MLEVVKLGLVRGLLEINREKIQEDLGEIEFERVENILKNFSLTVLRAYDDLLNEIRGMNDYKISDCIHCSKETDY
ncbi:MAG: hypothetical protein QW540_10830 [Archaeoglobaceae archaeon]